MSELNVVGKELTMVAPAVLRSGRGMFVAAASLVAVMAVLAGCSQESKTQPQIIKREPPQTASELLDQVVEAYHQADSYQDAGRLLVRYSHDGKDVNQSSEFSLALAGPSRLRMRAYHALVVCDGETFYATIDEAPGEVLSFPAPEELSPSFVYKDPVLANALNQTAGSVPLSLYLDPDPLPALLLNAHTPQFDPPQKIGDDNCYRVRIEKREGPFVLWIDQQTLVVRRVEYPTSGYRRLIEPYIGPIADLTITAELEGARLDPSIDDATFRFEPSSDAEPVQWFEIVRAGARVPKFKLRMLDGRLITRDSLAGKIVVIKFWQKDDVFKYYNDLSGFEEIQNRYKDQDSIVFLAVSADLEEVSDDDLKAALARAELSLPIARVDRKIAFRSLGLQIVPSTVILGRDGTLQDFVAGIYANEATALPKKLDTLLSGGNLALEAPEKAPDYLFYSGFAWQNTQKPEPEQSAELAAALAKAGIAPGSEPQVLRRKRLWRSTELRNPGNILAVPDDSASDKVFVIEGLPSVAEVGPNGKLLAKHRLDLPDRDDSAVTFLRTAADEAGHRYFLGSKIGVQQVHLFDSDWKRLLSFPESGDHPGISDATLADLDGDGKLEMAVGYVQAVGVHCVTLEGERLWRNRAAEYVFRLGVTGPDRRNQRQLLVAQGWVQPIDAAGREQAPIVLPDAFVRLIFTADLDGDENLEWCAIAMKSLEPGQPPRDIAVGLSPQGFELWRYPLPEGTHQNAAFEMAAAGNLLDADTGQWVIAGADGSIHILGIDGSLIDHFNLGAVPNGVAIARLDGRPALLVSASDTVQAWQFELPPQEEAKNE